MTSELTHIATNLSARITFHPLDDSVRRHLSTRYWRWLELFEHDPAARLSQHPDYIFTEFSPQAVEHNPIVLCEATRGNELVALGVLVPKSMTWRQAGGFGLRKQLSGYRLAGNRFLGKGDFDLLHRLLGACEDFCQQQNAMFLLIEDLEQSDTLTEAARSIAHLGTKLFCVVDWQDHWTIEFPPTPEDYWAKFTGKARYNFRRTAKRLGHVRITKTTEPNQIAEFLDTANAISLRTWQAKQFGRRIRNGESELAMFTFLASQQALRAYLLFVEEKPVAFLIGIQFRDRFSLEEMGYDQAFAERSPGQVLFNHVLEDLMQHDRPRVFDFGGGDADYKRIYATTKSTTGTVWLVPSSWRGTIYLTLLRTCHMIARSTHALARKVGIRTLLRQWIRGKRPKFKIKSGADDSHIEPGTDGAA